MPEKPTVSRGYEHPKIRAKRIEITLKAGELNALPRIPGRMRQPKSNGGRKPNGPA